MPMHMSLQLSQNGCANGAPIAAVALEASNTSERIRSACAASYQGLQDVLAAKLMMGGSSGEKAAGLASTINAAIEGVMIISRTKQDVSVLVNVANDMKILLQSSSRA